MFQSIRAVSPVSKPRCPQCHCFVRLDAGTCTACGVVFALGIKPEGSRQSVSSIDLIHAEPYPKGNAHAFEYLQPDGKIRKPTKKQSPLDQMNLFQGVL